MKRKDLKTDHLRQLFCRRLYHYGQISQKAAKECESLENWHWSWSKWDERFYELYEFIKSSGAYPEAEDTILPEWIQEQNKLYFEGRLALTLCRTLESLPEWKWDESYNESVLNKQQISYLRRWWDAYELFKKEAVASYPPAKRTHKSYIWWNTQRRNRKNLSLSQAKALEEVNALWHLNQAEYRWLNIFNLMKAFKKAHLRLPYGQETYQNINLGEWMRLQRCRHKTGVMPRFESQLLEELKEWTWNTYESGWDEMYQKMIEGTVPLQWLTKNRRLYRQGKLEESKIALLEAFPGWTWSPNEDFRNSRVQDLKDFVKEFRRLPQKEEWYRGKKIGTWCTKQRIKYNKGELSADMVAGLESINKWTWTQLEDEWFKNFRKLTDYVSKYNKLPYKSEESLGKWVIRQRQRKRLGVMRADEITALESINIWAWQKHEADWKNHYTKLMNFLETHKRYPDKKNDEGNAWYFRQSWLFSKGKLNVERQQKLEELPEWKWRTIQPI